MTKQGQDKTAAADSSTPIALPTRMVLSAFAGMGAATVCHPLGMFSSLPLLTYYIL
jgi:hypothetical protein